MENRSTPERNSDMFTRSKVRKVQDEPKSQESDGKDLPTTAALDTIQMSQSEIIPQSGQTRDSENATFEAKDKTTDAAKTRSDSQLLKAATEGSISKERRKLRAQHKSRIQSTGGDFQKPHKSTAGEQQRDEKIRWLEVQEASKTETTVDKTRKASEASITSITSKRLNTTAPNTNTPAYKGKKQKSANLDGGCQAFPKGSSTSSGYSQAGGENNQSHKHDDKRKVKCPHRDHGRNIQPNRSTVEPTPGCSFWSENVDEPTGPIEPGFSYWMPSNVYYNVYGHSDRGKDPAKSAEESKLYFITPYSTRAHKLTPRTIRLGKAPMKLKRRPISQSDCKKSHRKHSRSKSKDSHEKSVTCEKRKKWERSSSSRYDAVFDSKRRKKSLSKDKTKRKGKSKRKSRRRERSKSPDKTRRVRKSQSMETNTDGDTSSRKRCRTPNKTKRSGRTGDDDLDSDDYAPDRHRQRCRTPDKTRRIERTEDDDQDSDDESDRKRKRPRCQSPDKTKRVRREECSDTDREPAQVDYSQHRHRRHHRDPYEMVSLERKRSKFRKEESLRTRLLQYRTMQAALFYRQACCDRMCCLDWEMLDVLDVVGWYL